MNKLTKQLLASILAVALMFCATPMVHATSDISSETSSEVTSESSEVISADSTTETITVNDVKDQTVLNVEVGVDKTLEIPLTLTAAREIFYNCSNINPGDTMRAKVIFKNDSNTEDTQISVTDVINLLPENEKALALLDILELTIKIDGQVQYKGIHSKVTTPVTGWMNVPIGESIEMEIEVYFPKEADNRYQNAPLEIKWVFEARGDVPPDPVEPEIETGDNSNNNFGIYLLGSATLVAVLALLFVGKKKEKKN